MRAAVENPGISRTDPEVRHLAREWLLERDAIVQRFRDQTAASAAGSASRAARWAMWAAVISVVALVVAIAK